MHACVYASVHVCGECMCEDRLTSPFANGFKVILVALFPLLFDSRSVVLADASELSPLGY